MPNSGTIQATHIAHLPFPQLPSAATTGHVFPHLRNSLVSIGQICDQDYVALFDKKKMRIYESKTIRPLLNTLLPTPPVLEGHRDPTDRLWKIASCAPKPLPIATDHPQLAANSAYHQKNQQDLVTFLHAAAGSPMPSTWLAAIRKGHYATWPGLTTQLVTKHLPTSAASIKGHLDQQRQNIRSTKPTTQLIVDNPPSPTSFTDPDPHHVFLTILHGNGEIATDQTGAFPMKSSSGNQYIMVLYAYDPNAILVAPLKNRTGGELLRVYKQLHERLTLRGFRPKLQRLDNEASNQMKKTMKLLDVNFQLVPPHNHRRNAAERMIRTFKNHFVSILCSTDKNFPMSEWDQLLPQAELTLNLLRSSRINPRMSAWTQLEGTFNFNATPLAPPGTPIIVHEKPSQRASWAPHGLDGFYLGPALNHYRCYRTYVTNTKGTRVSDTVEFLPRKYNIPQLSSQEVALIAARELTHALQHPLPKGPLQVSDPHLAAIRQLSTIFTSACQPQQPTVRTAPPPRVAPLAPLPPPVAPPPRVAPTASVAQPPRVDPPQQPAPPIQVTTVRTTQQTVPSTPPRRGRPPNVPVVTPTKATTKRPPNMPPSIPIHRYNTRSQPHLIPNSATQLPALTKVQPTCNVLRTRDWTSGACDALLAKVIQEPSMMPMIFQPIIANHVVDQLTGKVLSYKDLMK